MKKKIFVLFMILLIPLTLVGGVFLSFTEEPIVAEAVGVKNINEAVLKWKSEAESAAKKWGVEEHVNLILAIMMVETGGSKPDIMQSSESKGLPMDTIDNERESIDAGVEHLSITLKMAEESGTDFWTAVGAYNFGKAYVGFVAKNGKQHTLEIAEKYSKEVVAPSLGNTNGTTYSYVNEISLKYGKTYLYLNGGNFFYVEMVKQYLDESGEVEGGTESGAPLLSPPSEYQDKLTLPTYNGKDYNSSGSYPFGQCTWYAYNRMYQLGKRVDEFMGNGADWGRTGKAKGYSVSNTPKVGTAMSFPGGVAGSSTQYGHVAVVEYVNDDGSVLISECNVVNMGSGTVSWRVISSAEAKLCLYVEP